MRSVLGDKRAIAILLGPALLIYTVVMLVPIVWSLGYTLSTGNPITGFSFTGLSNFSHFLHDATAHSAVWFTVRYAVVLTVLQVGVGYGLALLSHFWLKRASSGVRTLLFFPSILPTVAVALLFQQLFAVAPRSGVVNSLLGTFGVC